MAETLSYDNTPDTEVLTDEEQDSLEVGEELEAQHEQLLAGKYKNAEDLESAYIELQKKLGTNDGENFEGEEGEYDEGEYDEDEGEGDYEEVPDASPAVSLIEEASVEYYENDGELTPETIDKFSSMSSQDLVNAYIEIQKNNPEAQAQVQAAELSESSVNEIQNAAGGSNAYEQLTSWAADNLPDQEIDAFDNLIDSGNVAAIKMGLTALQSKYNEANGYEGRMLQGKKPSSSGQTYRSQAELVEAMGDPRYDNDPAYRQDVIERLNNSDLNF
tara:strand:- start:327 stop:1148 length:822 start_codon:yes stop_codon:yes gene_type:complete